MIRQTFSSRLSLIALLVALLCLLRIPAVAAIWYVDGAATGANNGTSWTNAWTTLAFNGLAGGDTIYISGGPSGGTQTYNLPAEFTSLPGFAQGSAGNPVTYKIGQDSLHNGTAIFNRTTFDSQFLFCGNNYIISGNAGDGNRHFKLNNFYQLLTLNNSSNVRVSFIDCGNGGGFGSINPGTNIELDNCYLYSTDLNLDHGLYAQINQGTAYDQSRFHDNVVNIPYKTGGIGADGFQIVGSGGWSLYNNTVTGFNAAYTNGQHQDGWQGSGGRYIKIYNNRFTNIQNYAIFAEGYTVSNTYSDMQIYNNICVLTTANSTQAIAISGSPSFPITNVICANNIADGYGIPFTFRYTGTPGNYPAAFSNCYFYNNVGINGGGNIIDSSVTAANNISLTSAQGATVFASYNVNSASNDYHLKTTATTLVGQGTNAFAYFTIDKDSNTRTSLSSWDLGPYISGTSAITNVIAPYNVRGFTTVTPAP